MYESLVLAFAPNRNIIVCFVSQRTQSVTRRTQRRALCGA